jgi:hypothetical protein
MHVAFKEWAVVVDTLSRGGQILILRKGGIHEGSRGFRMEHASFLLFPTLFHQQRESVVESAQLRFDQLAPHFTGPSTVRIGSYAQVVEALHVSSLEAAERLSGQHVWRREVIAQRFEWGNEQSIHAVAVRVFNLAEPVEIPMRTEYGGCKSWVRLRDEIAIDRAVPSMDDLEFAERLRQFRTALAGGKPAKPDLAHS